MTFLKYLLIVARWLSLDVVAGGVIFALAVAHVLGSPLHWSIPTALGCCIWLIYTLDHLIDGNRADLNPSMPRHAFHRKHRRPIFFLFVVVAGFGLRLLFLLPYTTLVYGCILLGMVGLYFLSIWLFRIYFAKEIFIAVLYACGVYLGSFSLGSDFNILTYSLFCQTVLLASINLLLFSYYEVSQDQQDGHQSWATYFGVDKTRLHIKWLIACLGVLIVCTFLIGHSKHQLSLQLIFTLMYVVLTFIYALPEWFENKERFRWVGDLVFLFPGLIFWF